MADRKRRSSPATGSHTHDQLAALSAIETAIDEVANNIPGGVCLDEVERQLDRIADNIQCVDLGGVETRLDNIQGAIKELGDSLGKIQVSLDLLVRLQLARAMSETGSDRLVVAERIAEVCADLEY